MEKSKMIVQTVGDGSEDGPRSSILPASLLGVLKPQANECRLLHSLAGFWEFRMDPEKKGEELGWPSGFDSQGELAVPGSWNEQRLELMHYFGLAWYQTTVEVPQNWANRSLYVHFGCAQTNARIWLNGVYVGKHEGGSLPFSFSLDHLLRPGQINRLVVAVDATIDPWALPPGRLANSQHFEGYNRSNPAISYDFFPYGGLPRPVTLQIMATRVEIADIKLSSKVDSRKARACLLVSVCIKHPEEVMVRCRIAGHAETKILEGEGRAEFQFNLEAIALWDTSSPRLYRLTVEAIKGGAVVDTYHKEIGFREVRVENDQLLLNNRPIFLKGFGKHEDFPVAGRGLVGPVIVKDFDLLRWMGANSFRTSHYPYAEEWYEFADRNGVLVIAETPFVGLNDRMFVPPVLERAKRVLREMIERDRDHPSVIMWSVANEPTIRSEAGHDFFRELLSTARQLDQSRLVTYVAHEEPEQNQALKDVDVVCVNKYYGWYEDPGDIESSKVRLGACLDRFRAAFGKPVLFSEFGADGLPGMHTLPAEMFSEEYQSEILAAQIEVACSRPWVIGVHAWAFADFKVAQSVTRAVYNHKGVFTRDRQPKMAAHTLRKLWQGPDPVLLRRSD